MSLPESGEFWAAIMGAIVGGFIAALTQWSFARSQRKQHERALATSLLLKLGRLTATLIVTKQHIDDCFADAGELSPNTQPWMILMPVGNLADPVHFTSDELSVLLNLSNDKISRLVLGLDDRHNTIMTAMRDFQDGRAELIRKLEPHRMIDRVDGDRVEERHPPDVMQTFIPYTIDLNSTISYLREALPRDVKMARTATERAQTLLMNRLGLKFKVEIYDPPENNGPTPSV